MFSLVLNIAGFQYGQDRFARSDADPVRKISQPQCQVKA